MCYEPGPVHGRLVELGVVPELEAAQHPEAGHDLQHGLEAAQVVGGGGETDEAGHQLQPAQIMDIGPGDIEDLDIYD